MAVCCMLMSVACSLWQTFLVLCALFLTVALCRWLLDRILIGGFHARPVLITGCDTGFGHLLTIRLLENGLPVFAACLTEEGMDTLKTKAKNLPGTLETFIMDVTSDESVKAAVTFVESKTSGLWGVVNNAGIMGVSAPDDWLSMKHYEQCLSVNTLGVIRVTHAFTHLVKRRQGRLVTVASVCGRVALPVAGPYTVSKFAVEGYMDTIRGEMMSFGVSVSTLEPGFFKTNILDTEKAAGDTKKVFGDQTSDVKELYGEVFLEETIKARTKVMIEFASPATNKVVDAYFHALLSRFPRPRYQIGWDCVLFFVPLSMMWTPVQDWCMLMFARAQNAVQPQGSTVKLF